MQMIIAVRECALHYLFSTCFDFYQKEGINQMWSMFGVLYAPIAIHLCIEIMCFIAKITINVVDRTNKYIFKGTRAHAHADAQKLDVDIYWKAFAKAKQQQQQIIEHFKRKAQLGIQNELYK